MGVATATGHWPNKLPGSGTGTARPLSVRAQLLRQSTSVRRVVPLWIIAGGY